MNPVEIGRGHSFKGLAAYLSHDVKASTTERIGWAESHNLNDADINRSWQFMAATAQSASALKEAAGEAKTGAKVRKPVYHFALTWSETDQISNDLQKKAVGEALKTLGLDKHQSLAIQHTDGKPHVHVMVNMVNPENGTVPKLSYSHKNLRKWANQFEQKHGLEITEGSHQNAQRRKNGEQVDAKRKPRNVYEQQKAEGQNPRLKWLRNQEKQIAQTLQIENKEMREQHSTQWEAIKEGYKTHKAEMHTAKDADIKAAIEDVKTTFKPKWAKLYKQNREVLQKFDAGEKSPVAKAFNMGRTFIAARKDGQNMGKSFYAASNKAERRLYVEKNNQKREQRLGRELKGKVATAISKVKKQHSSTISKVRNTYLADCKELSATQKAERGQQKGKWKTYNQRRQQNHEKIATLKQGQSRQQRHGFSQSFEPE